LAILLTAAEFIMIAFNPKCIRKILVPGVFYFLALIAASIHPMQAEILLKPPGLRLIKDPSLVIPADFHYSNRPIKLPAYRDTSGNPASGWSVKFIDTRRFASDQSAWIFFRNSDLQRSVYKRKERGLGALRFWPVETTIVMEIYKGNASSKENGKLIEIAAMAKVDAVRKSFSKVFYPVSWTYARFNPDGNSTITSAKVRECHQCHSIAFHLTGDLIFTQFP
jgi:hypothetical protein